MVDPTKVLNLRRDKEYQVNISVKSEYVQQVADALDFLLRLDPYKSKSELFCQAIIAFAEDQRAAVTVSGDGHDGPESEPEVVPA